MYINGLSLCSTNNVLGQHLELPVSPIDRNAIPVAVRRRTSCATQLALTAAFKACEHADVAPTEIPAVFASVGGEMQVTDNLCIELAKPDGTLSPTQFHNSVHNTASGYWSIIAGNHAATTAMAAGQETVAMAMVEITGKLSSRGGDVLLIFYDELWPEYLEPGMGTDTLAMAFVLSATPSATTQGVISHLRPALHPLPVAPELEKLISANPVFASILLYQAIHHRPLPTTIPLGLPPQQWWVDVDGAL